MRDLRAANLGEGAVVLRNGLQCVKGAGAQGWTMRRFGRFDDATVQGWIDEGAEIAKCCGRWGIGDHDPVEHEVAR